MFLALYCAAFVLLPNYLPFGDKLQIFNLSFGEDLFPEMITVNYITLAVLNIASFICAALVCSNPNEGRGQFGQPLVPPPVEHAKQQVLDDDHSHLYASPRSGPQFINQQEPTEIEEVLLQEPLAESTQTAEELAQRQSELERFDIDRQREEITQGLKNDVEDLFAPYMNEAVQNDEAKVEDLEKVEAKILNYLNKDIDAVICLDSKGNRPAESIFHWEGISQQDLLQIFKLHQATVKEMNTGTLCQMIFQHINHWYLIAKFRNKYIVMRSTNLQPTSLLDTGYRVLTEL